MDGVAESQSPSTGAASWVYREHRPPHLAAYVDFLWYFEGPTACRHKRIFPNGKVELLVNMAGPYRVVEGSGDRWIRGACAAGLQRGPMVIEQPAWQRVMGVRLRPAGAAAVLHLPGGALSGQVVALDTVLGAAGRELSERCAGAADPSTCLRLLRCWLEERIIGAPAADPAVAWAAQTIERAGGAVATEALRTAAGLSKARWASAFREEIGLAPKLYARVVRFGRVLGALQREERLAAVAAAAYYDQPHMAAEFRKLAGITPRQLLERRHPVGDGSTAAERRPG